MADVILESVLTSVCDSGFSPCLRYPNFQKLLGD
jgi:hypothetical protein